MSINRDILLLSEFSRDSVSENLEFQDFCKGEFRKFPAPIFAMWTWKYARAFMFDFAYYQMFQRCWQVGNVYDPEKYTIRTKSKRWKYPISIESLRSLAKNIRSFAEPNFIWNYAIVKDFSNKKLQLYDHKHSVNWSYIFSETIV